MEMTMSNDTTKTRELTEAELAAVSGGAVTLENVQITSYTLENVLISGYSFAGGGGSGTGSAGWDLTKNKAG